MKDVRERRGERERGMGNQRSGAAWMAGILVEQGGASDSKNMQKARGGGAVCDISGIGSAREYG